MADEQEQPKSITFSIEDKETGLPVELILMNAEGFFYRGERVEDREQVYGRFCEWLGLAEKSAQEELKRQEALTKSLTESIDRHKKDSEAEVAPEKE